jgi:hypothetical protein
MAMFADITSNKLYEVFFKSELAEWSAYNSEVVNKQLKVLIKGPHVSPGIDSHSISIN